MKRIAIDSSDFEYLIENDYIYVDKTHYLYKIANYDRYYFLSRPRRFGKSLTVSTLKAIFAGEKELFSGLAIADTDWEWDKYPILHLDFNGIESKTPEILKNDLNNRLVELAGEYDITLDNKRPNAKFRELINKLYAKYDKGVVVLVDEYDKPMINHLGQGTEELQIARGNRDFLKSFYDNLKATDIEHKLKKVFLTGVSKFSKVSIFSTLNNLIELDSHPEFATMLGYTEEELHSYFHEYLANYAEKQNKKIEEVYQDFKYMYNGFRFTGTDVKVYNPFSVGRALTYMELNNYWFESGMPTFLIDLLKERNYNIMKLENLEIGKEEMKAYDLDNLRVESLLYQTGYLTISNIEGGKVYTLTYPNIEVEEGFCNQLLKSLAVTDRTTPVIYKIKKALLSENYDQFIELIKSVYAGIPYSIVPKDTAKYEQYYHTLFYLIVNLMVDNEMDIYPELITSSGRIDMVIEVPGNVYIIEFKCNQDANTAVNQIKDKRYAEQYKIKNKNIKFIGINFNTNSRNIDEWKLAEEKDY